MDLLNWYTAKRQFPHEQLDKLHVLGACHTDVHFGCDWICVDENLTFQQQVDIVVARCKKAAHVTEEQIKEFQKQAEAFAAKAKADGLIIKTYWY